MEGYGCAAGLRPLDVEPVDPGSLTDAQDQARVVG